MSTWGFTETQVDELDLAHWKQLKRMFSNPHKKNFCQETKKKTTFIWQWKRRMARFEHILRLDNIIHGQEAMK